MACTRHHEASPALSQEPQRAGDLFWEGKRSRESHQERGRKRRARKGMRCACGRLLIDHVWSAGSPRAENQAAP
eukprot:scaffold27784_cov66-Phaeocystis_antarctica.AAC.8